MRYSFAIMYDQKIKHAHTFHIPVMGIGYTIDTPLKVAHLGIDSVISLVDDILLEKLRKMHCGKYGLPYKEITGDVTDHRAKRITAYLDMLGTVTDSNFAKIKSGKAVDGKTITDYLDMLPSNSDIRRAYEKQKEEERPLEEILNNISKMLYKGSIDVNIMTKVDKDNFHKGEQLPKEYNDAHAALRGFANSKIESSLVLSAGLNPSLYAYIENFDGFFPDRDMHIRKKVVLKVSDFKSALIQGKFLAKKGIWVSEYRVESGLNCGGHAFATNGLLMGPILAEFRQRKEELISSVHEILCDSLQQRNRPLPHKPLAIKLTVQGGVGTAAEHQFLLDHYGFDSVGWGTPFLLVPEATNVDMNTIAQLQAAGEDDLYLSDISPLGVPFNSMRGNTKDLEKEKNIAMGHVGSKCPKKYVALNREFTKRGICPASRLYQLTKLRQLDKEGLSEDQKKEAYARITEKSCICVGLGTAALIKYGQDTITEGRGVSVCPGPNMAYFSEKASLKNMLDHIYGRVHVRISSSRPHMFLKELKLYIDFLQNRIKTTSLPITTKQQNQLFDFTANLQDGIDYYTELFSKIPAGINGQNTKTARDLKNFKLTIPLLNSKINSLELTKRVHA